MPEYRIVRYLLHKAAGEIENTGRGWEAAGAKPVRGICIVSSESDF